MAAFKILIVGGSVAGLTLANILEQYGIDYVLLEKHKIIAPHMGASIAIWPYALRVLEQLGMFEKLSSISMPLNALRAFGPDGGSLDSHEDLGEVCEALMGYRVLWLDRQQLIQTLFDNLKDTSKVHTSSEISKIDRLDGAVEVTTADGSVFRGDIIVGADGVHSMTRQELWRIADVEDPTYRSDQLSQSIVCNYKCIFGISRRGEDIPDEHGFKTYRKNRSYLYQSGPEGKFYWFVFIKNPEKTIHKSIPRYTAEDADKLAAEYADDVLFPGFKFGDLYAQRMAATLVPLEEYILERSFYKRGTLIGDSFHKVNPLTGHGGNNAIESAAVFADMLKEALDKTPQLDDRAVQTIFATFQERRQQRIRPIVEATQLMQRLEILDNLFLEFIALKVMSRASTARITPRFVEHATRGHVLQYLPLENDKGAVALSLRVKTNPEKRKTPTTALWILLMVSIAASSFCLSRYPELAQYVLPTELFHSLEDKREKGFAIRGFTDQAVYQAYTSTLAIVVNCLWVVESYRFAFFVSPLRSAIPFALASIAFGWEIVLPVYFAIHIFLSRGHAFYYPEPRAINVSAAKALTMALSVAYIVPTIQAMANMSIPSALSSRVPGTLLLSFAHVGMPIALRIFEKLERKSPQTSVQEVLYGTQDMKYLSQFFTTLCVAASTVRLVFVTSFYPRLMTGAFSQIAVSSMEWIQLEHLGITVLLWCLFIVWDLKRVNVMDVSLGTASVIILGGYTLFGPAAVLAGLWRWRESAMEKSRKRK